MSWWKNDPLAEATTTSKWWEADPVVSIDLPEEEPAPRFAQERGLGVPEPVAAKKPKMVIEPFDASKHKPRDLGLGGESTEILITEDAPDGGYWNIPTVWWNDKGEPRVFSREEAQQIASMYEAETGKKFPRFSSPEEGVTAAQSRSNAGGGQGSALATRRQAQIDSTDDARAERGFGRSAYLDDGMTPNLPTNTPVRDIIRTAQQSDDPFAGEGFGSLAARRGQQFAKGATEVVAAIPEASAISSAGVEQTQVDEAKELLARRAEQITDLQSRLVDGMPERERAFIQQQISDLQIGQEELRKRATADVVPASERERFKIGDEIRQKSEDVFGAPDPRDTSFWASVFEAGGNAAGFGVGSMLPGGVAVGAGIGASLNKAQVYKEAIAAGADEETAQKASDFAMVFGASEIVPISRALKALPPRLRPKIGGVVMRKFADIAQASGEEAAQEYLQTVANNVVAQKLYDPDRGWTDGATEGALVGAVVGGILGGGVALATPNRPEPNDRERINSPRLTENDRKSPIPNDIIDDGKAAIDDLLSGKIPSGAVPMDTLYGKPVAPLDEAAPNVRTPTPEAVQRPLPTDRLSPTLGAPQEADTAPQRPETTVAPTAPVAATERTYEDLPEEDGDVPTGRTIRVYDDGQVEYLDQEQNAQTKEPVPQDQEPLAVPDVPVAAPKPTKPVTPPRETLQKRPLTNALKSVGVKPGSPLAVELEARGINARTAPGLFKATGHTDWDNLPASEWGDYARVIGEDGNGYLSRDGLIQAVEGEMRGEPVQVGNQIALQEAKDLREYAQEFGRDDGVEIDLSDVPEARSYIPVRDEDISTPTERAQWVRRDIDAALSVTNMKDIITPAEYAELYDGLEANGGNAEDMLWGIIRRSADGAEQPDFEPRGRSQATAPAVRQGLGEQAIDRGAEGRGAARDANAQGADGRSPQAEGAVDGRSLSNGEVPKRGNQADAAIIGDGEAAPTSAVSAPGASAQDTADVARNGLAVQPADATPQAADVPQVAPDVATASKTLADARKAFNVLDQNKKIEDAQAYFAASSALSKARDGMADALAERGGRIELKTDNGLGAVITPRPDGKPGARITYFDGKGFSGDTSHDTLKAAVRDAIGQGYEIEAKGYLKNRQALWPKSTRTDAEPPKQSAKTTSEPAKTLPKLSEGFVIRNKDTGEVVMETRDQAKIDALNTDKYEAVPVRQHLAELNDTNSKARKAAEQAPSAKKANPAVNKVNEIVAPDNAEGTGFYTNSDGDVQIDDLGNGDAEITITTSKTRYRGRAKETKENSQRLKYSEVKESLSPAARAAVEKIIGEQAASTDQTEAGTQNVIPGAEQSTERSEKARDADRKREADVRARQSKMRTGVPQDGPGGLFDTQGDMFKEQRQLDMFYSPLYRAIENAKQAKAPAGDWKAIIAKLPGVKKAETDWLGVEDWLDSQEGTQVSRDDLLAFVRDSQVEIVEDRLGGRPEGFDAAFEALRNDEASEGWSDADVEEQVLADAEIGGEYSPANFETYTEDGGDNYREILLRVPNLHESGKNKPPAADFGEVNRIQAQMDALLQEGQAPTELDADTYKEWKRLQNERNLARAADVARRGENRKRPFVQSSHFEQENIVVHARVKDRVGPNGERVLFVEEIQSDLASKWRENSEAPEVTARRRELGAERDRLAEDRRGLTGRVASVLRDEFEAAGVDGATSARKAVFAIEDRVNQGADQGGEGALYANLLREVDIETYQSVVDLMRERKAVQDELIALGTEKSIPEGTPDTPFKEEHTYNLMVKRLLRMAAEEGYDQLSWTPGYMQAERWNSAAQSVVEGIEWDSAEIPGYRYVNIQMASGGQSFSVSVEPSGRIEGSTNRELEGKQLSSLVGPGLAKQIMTEQSGRADNQKITFPDSGYAIAYDQQTKRAVDKLVKKHGTQVRVDKSMPDFAEPDNLVTAARSLNMSEAEAFERLRQAGIQPDTTVEKQVEKSASWGRESADDRDQAARLIMLRSASKENRILDVLPESAKPVWSVTITPELREAAMQPMAMFRQPSAQDAATVEAALPDLQKRLKQLMLGRVKLEAVEGATFQGAFEARGDDLRILVGQTQDGMKTVNHEAVHALRNLNLFTDAEWDALSDQAVAEWLDKYDIANRYDDLNAEAQIEEAIAEAFADFVAEQTEPGPIKSAFAKMRRMFRALKEWVTGNPSVQGVFEAVDSGRVGGRQSQGGTDTRALQKQINTATEAFKRWFGDSKVVDADGKPLVVYHGTAADFEAFDTDKTGKHDSGWYGRGIYLTAHGSQASSYAGWNEMAGAAPEGGRVIPAYVSLQNPYIWPEDRRIVDRPAAARDLTRELIEMGHDGVIVPNKYDEGIKGKFFEIVAFRPEQIKSVYNRGTFDPNDARIRYQRQATARQKAQETFDQMPRDVAVPNRAVFDELFARNRSMFQNIGQAKGAVGDRMDVAREYMQDRILPLRRVQEAIEREIGQPIAEEMNAYVKEETYHGKVGRRLEDIRQFTLEPISDLIAESDSLDAGKVNDYLTALHAEERNARIAKINPEMPDGGSGMSDAEAQKILKDAKLSKDYAALKEIARLVAKLRDDTLQLRVDAGLMTAKDAAILKAMYKNYVPLKGFEEFDGSGVLSDRPNVGRGYSVKGPETKRALGRKSRSFDVLANILSQAQEVAIRAEKNQVGKAVFDLASQYPSENIWRVREVETKRVFNKQTGLVETRSEAPTARALAENEMAVKIDGKEYRIEFMDERLTRAMGAVKVGQMGDLVRILSLPARYFSAVNTMIDPEFVVRNAFRDMQAAQINIRNFGEADRNRIAKGMIANWPKAFAAAFKGQGANKPDTEWTKWYREFEEAGAKVSFWKMEDADRMKSDLERQIFLKRGNIAKRAGKFAITPSAWFSAQDNAVLGFIERTNLAVDNAVRLAAYVEARKSGWSKQKAASLSKNLTVNFNRRGHYGPVMNALYPFYNAGMQGTQVLFRAMSNPKRMGKYVVGMVGVGFISDLINAAISDEDDDGVLAYDKIQKFKQEMSFQISTGDDVLTVPLSYGYNVFPYMGQLAGQVYRGVKDPDEAFIDFVDAAVSAFSPVYESDAMRTMLPMVMDLPYDLATNSDWLHRPIRPENPYGDYGPDAYKHYGGASEWAKGAADFANRATGGTIAEPGMIDVSPEYLDHIWGFASGGAGRFVSNTGDMAAKILSGKTDEIEGYRVPFARQVFSETGLFLDRDRYYRFREEVNEAAEARETAQEAGEPLSKLSYDLSKLKNEVKLADKVLRAIRKERAAVGDDATADQRKEWEAREAKAILRFNQKYVNIAGASIE